MTRGSSLLFFLLGLGMTLAPRLVPQAFPANGLDGSSSRAVWLALMGALNLSVGLGYAASRAVAAIGARFPSFRSGSPDSRSAAPLFTGAVHRVDLS